MRKPPKIMGILNVTPDSFSDGGKFLDPGTAVARALEMQHQGADIIDMGAESSRPGSSPVPVAEQLRRLLPVLKAFMKHSKCSVSIDTRSAVVAEACLNEGAAVINDISALRSDRKMLPLLARSRCQIVLMHMRGTPKTMQKKTVYADVIVTIRRFFKARLRTCEEAGIDSRRIILDPGIGFGKTAAHNIEILKRLDELKVLGRPILIGVSRKRFLGTLTGQDNPALRDTASIAAGIQAALNGASVLRVHNVAGHVATMKVAAALGG